MKVFILLLAMCTITNLQAKENLICGVTKGYGKLLGRAVLDLDSSQKIETVFYNDKSAALNIEQGSNDFITISLSDINHHHVITLNKEMVLSMGKNKSFAMFPNLDQEGAICYNMKDEDLAPFDL